MVFRNDFNYRDGWHPLQTNIGFAYSDDIVDWKTPSAQAEDYWRDDVNQVK
ncbi:MAG: hypothetical protein HRT89_13110 [Lentisphaeria bacterium]|nr:hypothetical protein [Lentisphaeria bacterium]NQZ68996.1 hypothetical protein [Lentisphaeria bacterium]